MYYYLFTIVYSGLKKIEAGLSYQTDNSRAQQTILLISIFELLNLMSIFPHEMKGRIIIAPFVGLIVVNYLIFCLGDRYRKIVSNNVLNGQLSKAVTILYITFTVLFFGITR